MIDAAKFKRIETLKNGSQATVRAIRTDDKHRLSEAFRNLEAESVYTRFFSHKKTLTDSELKAATEVDFEEVVALVVTLGEGPDEVIIGAGRYVLMLTPDRLRTAEVAFTVEEDFHRQGIAGRLLRHLAEIAREKGVRRFHAEVLPGNTAMLSVFARSGFPMEKRLEDGTVSVSLSLLN
ncbi:MAG: GNAT family N-acetyltransferase [Desulfatitalea sp.]|nr:GNAT family N-acetyltransferase [Desulfatitalea sp.]MBI5896635.1 GNAT family N-acetyltransferase [Desulfobacterales bacterium]